MKRLYHRKPAKLRGMRCTTGLQGGAGSHTHVMMLFLKAEQVVQA